MANDVYRAAVDGLTALVPPKAAQRLVDDSLRSTKRTSDDVSVAAMRRLLLGPIREELAGVLPPSAVGPGLKRIAAGLHGEPQRRRAWWRRRRAPHDAEAELHLAEDDTQPPDAVADPDHVAATPGVPRPALAAAAKAVATSGPGPSVRSSMQRPEQTARDAVVEPDGTGVTAVALSNPVTAGPPAPPPTAAPARTKTAGAPLPRLDDALVDRALKRFGELETVRQVVAVSRGELLSSSGEGLEPERLPALVHATAGLLGKAGRLDVFALENASGSMFMFPLTGGALVVLTKPKVNFGAVLAARAALEEAA